MRRFPRSGVRRLERFSRASTFPALLLTVLLFEGVAASAAPVAEERGVYLMDLFAGSHALAESEMLSQFLVDLFKSADPDSVSANRVTARELLESGAARIRETEGIGPANRARDRAVPQPPKSNR